MSSVLLVVVFILGCALLAWSADRFIQGCVVVATHFHVPQLIVGMVLIGFGTSCPELIVSFFSSIKGTPGIAIGNALGSNIANMGLVTGVAALFAPLCVQRKLLYREYPFLLLVTLILGVIFYGGVLGRWQGVLLLLLFVFYMGWMILSAKRAERRAAVAVTSPDEASQSLLYGVTWSFIGLLVLLGSAEMIVDSASEIAVRLGLDPLLVGLTIVAMGTSLPELAATVTSALKGHYDLAIGNIVGSSLFNLLAVLCIPALIAPSKTDPLLFSRDFVFLLGITLLFWVLAAWPPKREWITRWGGALLVLYYLGYIAFLVMTSVS